MSETPLFSRLSFASPLEWSYAQTYLYREDLMAEVFDERPEVLFQPTQDQTRSNCKSRFFGFQGEYTPKVEIPGRGVPEM